MAGGTFESDNDDFDSQDQSEAFDEANTIGDGDQGEVRTFADADARGTFEEMPDVVDLLQLASDRDDDDPFDPDADADEDVVTLESDAKGG